MSLGIPGDAVMALLLGALIIQGIQPGPRLISENPDIFWELIASLWTGNLLLLVINVPQIVVWVRLLTIPFRLPYPTAIFLICIGVYSANNDVFEVAETMGFGVLGYLLIALGFEPAPILLGFVLGPRLEENFRRPMILSRGDLGTFVDEPISAVLLLISCMMLGLQLWCRLRCHGPAPGRVAAGFGIDC